MELTRRHINLAAVGVLLAAALIRFPVPDNQGRALMRVIAEASLCLCLAGFVAHRVNGWLGAFVALAVFSWLYAFRIPHPTSQRIAYLGRDAVMFGAGALLVFYHADWKWVRRAFIGIGLANLVFIFMQEIGLDPFGVFTFGLMKSTSLHSTGLMANKNESAILFVMAFFTCFPGKMLAGLMLAGVCIASSTGGFLALAVGIVACKGMDWKWIALSAGLLVALILAFDPSNVASVACRLRIWGLGDHLLADNALLGVGIGLWPVATKQLHAHCDILQAFFEMGYMAPIITAGYAISVFSRFTGKVRVEVAGLSALLVNATVSFPMHIPVLGLMGLALIGSMESKLERVA